MQRRSLLLIISAILAIVGVGGVFVYVKSAPDGAAAATQPVVAPARQPVTTAPRTPAAPKAATAGLQIPRGMMAVSLNMSTIASVAGYVQQHAQIAIFDTYPTLGRDATVPSALKDPQSKSDDWATRLVVPRARVLAVAPYSAAGNTTADQGTRMITVAVGQDDAQRLIHVSQTGRLYFTLLTNDSRIAPGPGVDNQGRRGKLFPAGGTGVKP